MTPILFEQDKRGKVHHFKHYKKYIVKNLNLLLRTVFVLNLQLRPNWPLMPQHLPSRLKQEPALLSQHLYARTKVSTSLQERRYRKQAPSHELRQIWTNRVSKYNWILNKVKKFLKKIDHLRVFYVVPSNEETFFQPPAMVYILVIIHIYTLQITMR